MGTSGYIEQGSIFYGLHWLAATFGDRSTNISFSGGVGYISWPEFLLWKIKEELGRIMVMTSMTKTTLTTFLTIQDTTTTSLYPTWGWGGYYGYDRREQALRDELYSSNYYNNFNTEVFQFNDFQLASLFSISAITPIGKKASFIFDSMIISRNKKQLVYTGVKEVDIDYTVFNTITGMEDFMTKLYLLEQIRLFQIKPQSHHVNIYASCRFSKR